MRMVGVPPAQQNDVVRGSYMIKQPRRIFPDKMSAWFPRPFSQFFTFPFFFSFNVPWMSGNIGQEIDFRPLKAYNLKKEFIMPSHTKSEVRVKKPKKQGKKMAKGRGKKK